jgi:DNA-binding NarL/FixJ family response regulator
MISLPSDLVQAMLHQHSRLKVIGTASSGPAGLALVRRLVPNLLLVDMQMPGMNGVEVTQAVRVECEFPGREVYVTGSNSRARRSPVRTAVSRTGPASAACSPRLSTATVHSLTSASRMVT